MPYAPADITASRSPSRGAGGDHGQENRRSRTPGDDFIALRYAGVFLDGKYRVIGVVKRGAHQVVHRGIDKGEIFCFAMLEIFHFGEQQTGVANQCAAGFEQNLELAISKVFPAAYCVVGHGRRRFVAVANSQTAAEIEVMKLYAFFFNASISSRILSSASAKASPR